MSADKTEKENLLNSARKGGSTFYDEESVQMNHINPSAAANGMAAILDGMSSIDGARTIMGILFIVFECIPIIMGGYILNGHYSLYFVALFAVSLFAIMCLAKQKFHYVVIIVFMYATYLFMLFAIASDAFQPQNASLYHIEKMKTVSVLWIMLQVIIAGTVYVKCCKPQSDDVDDGGHALLT
eukprot:CAMPEP_0197027636 /NCGR_PEP_ID=MMETSP1384-20130603/7517_1 /TAXON_ID=29189 /ORGANISM="Ammonia sp." /LENGTH=182 /DNA_ID=CAMNT_0042456507 /DNA_START=34 /DNA_END=582 /DNA_ORIENTATION=+